MKQSVLDLTAFVAHPSKKFLKKHKRIVGLSPFEAAKKATERAKRRDIEKTRKFAEYNHQVEKWEDYLQSSTVVDQKSKNAAACFESFGPAPTLGEATTQEACLYFSQESYLSDDGNRGCKLSP
jgi:hypothetical protein